MKKLFFTLIAFLLAHVIASACTSSFTYAVNPSNPLEITFSNNSSVGNTNNIQVDITLDYGDGTTGTGFYNVHTYATAGTYTVWQYIKLTDSATNNVVCSDSTSQSINASFSPCYTTISSTIGASGAVTFATNNPAGTSGMTYSWDFGDTNTGTGANPSHTYAANGFYTVTLTATGGGCTFIDTQMVTIGNMVNCANLHANFSSSVSNSTATFSNTSNGISSSVGNTYITTNYYWYFGDGNTSTDFAPSHGYTAAGTYTVTLIAKVIDSFTQALYCTDSITHTVTVGAPVYNIGGNIVIDSTTNPPGAQFRVWLIADDTIAHTLTAVDSATVPLTLNSYSVPYSFTSPANGAYLVKAALLNGPASGSGLVPTYAYSSLYWNTATIVNFGGGVSSPYNNILMQTGTVTSGPGFVGGSVLAGANKGTGGNGAPVAGMIMYLQDAGNNLIAYTYTDANGNYSFSNIPVGTYRAYPEAIGYETTPWTTINVTATAQNQINFQQHTVSKTITPITTGVANVAKNADMNLFPNPANGIVNLTWNKALNNTHVTIVDVMGRKAMETDLTLSGNEGRTQLNLSGLQSGVYFISVKSDNATYNTKVILQH